MGSVYAERSLGYAKPRVALLANGEEDTKGDKLVQDAHALLRRSHLNFVGNAEPKDALVGGVCDVLVCDGFVGNLFIKQAEAIVRLAAELAWAEIKRDLPRRLLPGLLPAAVLLGMKRTRLGALLGMLGAIPAVLGSVMIPALLRFRTKADYRAYGGAPLLGLRGVAIVAHGKSDAEAIASAIRQAKEAVERRSVTGIADAIGMNGTEIARGR
jgi:glycerol-3-phosphate acyltransferase PlsX